MLTPTGTGGTFANKWAHSLDRPTIQPRGWVSVFEERILYSAPSTSGAACLHCPTQYNSPGHTITLIQLKASPPPFLSNFTRMPLFPQSFLCSHNPFCEYATAFILCDTNFQHARCVGSLATIILLGCGSLPAGVQS
ncbi:hypothetical protein M404DRAFT_1004764 [Pisolithus tinctorius Marx 270]|uniref:Uncharacterized protein n=1 Tax=Pisolithus tinctorius Marx 270 TaxID=870435 RepID=A0A0C3NV37_PISTI|nr:hypothetical protein M404DRAFT_1004764 [Pisolithus tinctorius Marx 270]